MNLSSLTSSGNFIYDKSHSLIASLGLSDQYVTPINLLVMLVLLVIVLAAVDYITKKFLVVTLTVAAQRTKTKFDDYLIQNKALARLAHVVPLIISLYLIPTVLAGFPDWIDPVRKFIEILLVVAWVSVINAVFKAIGDLL